MRSQETGAAGYQCALCHAFLAVAKSSERHSIGMCGWAADTVIREALGGHHLRLIQVASINYDGITQFLADLAQIKVGEFFPFCQDQQGIRLVSCLVW